MLPDQQPAMWRYQGRFQSIIDLAARDTFTALDQALDARAFLVGFRRSAEAGAPAVCIEPDDIGYDAALLEQVPRLAATLAEQDKAPRPPAAEARAAEGRIVYRAWQKAFERVLARQEEAAGWRSYASWPVDVADHRVVCVLQLTREVADSCYALMRDTTADGEPVATSLLDALVAAFLTSCTKALGAGDPGTGSHVLDRTVSEFHRSAGRGLMYTVAHACQCPEALHALYDAISELSAARYEGGATHGCLVLAAQAHPNVECLVQFDTPVMLAHTKAARKILEVVTADLSALSDGSKVYGLGRLRGAYDPKREDIFLVEFPDHYAWQLSHAGHSLMRVQYGRAALPAQPFDATKLASTLARIFKELEPRDVDHLCTLVRAATGQRHGTLLVISDQASQEARRLAAQSTLIQATTLSAELVESLTAIDGALLLDPQGRCHAIGVILDGLTSGKGSSARGARYNSAVRYVDTATRQFGHRCIAVVVSEDGPTDIIPELMPQIRRSLITDQIKAFEALKGSCPVKTQDFNRFVRWFQAHKFYLWPDAATEINRIRREVEFALEASNVSIAWRRIEPNPDLDDSYFTD